MIRSVSRRLVLGIESTFDETGAAVIDANSGRVMGHALASTYTDKFGGLFGGVVPTLAGAEQDVWLNRVIARAMVDAGVTDCAALSAVAVAVGPGLAGCLRQGVRRAAHVSRRFQVPLLRVNHLEAHLLSPRLDVALAFPFLALLVSGGHTQLVVSRGVGDHVFLGGTIDDAVGQAYDKVARALGVDGGGAAIERLALNGDPTLLPLTVPLVRRRNCLFSFTGLKTMVERTIELAEPSTSAYWKLPRTAPVAVRNPAKLMHLPLLERLHATGGADDAALQALERQLPPALPESLDVLANPRQFLVRPTRPAAPEQLASDVAASFQNVAIQHLMSRVRIALGWCAQHCPDVNTVVLSGGVARNQALIAALGDVVAKHRVRVVVPRAELCTDNGIMIAWAGVEQLRAGLVEAPLRDTDPDIEYRPVMPLASRSSAPAPAPSSSGGSRPSSKLDAIISLKYR
jgi:glycoprotease/Kae1 family metallohydrolase